MIVNVIEKLFDAIKELKLDSLDMAKIVVEKKVVGISSFHVIERVVLLSLDLSSSSSLLCSW